MLTSHYWGSVAFIWEQFYLWVPASILYNEFENFTVKITVTSPGRQWLNTLRMRQNGRHLADNTFKHIFLKENVRISLKISLKFVPKSPVDNIPALFQIMAWCRPGDKPLSWAMMVSLLMHICLAPSSAGPTHILDTHLVIIVVLWPQQVPCSL